MYLLFLAMLTALIADCQAWTWDAWQHDTPLFRSNRAGWALQLFLFLIRGRGEERGLVRDGGLLEFQEKPHRESKVKTELT